MTDKSVRHLARMLDRIRESNERQMAERDPQEELRVTRNVIETVAVSDSVSTTEHVNPELTFATDGPSIGVGEI